MSLLKKGFKTFLVTLGFLILVIVFTITNFVLRPGDVEDLKAIRMNCEDSFSEDCIFADSVLFVLDYMPYLYIAAIVLIIGGAII